MSTTAPELPFYFDYLSPYAYLAWQKAREVAERGGARLVPKPILFAGLLNHWGQRGPAEIPPKARFVLVDCARRAKQLELPFRCPRFHPFKPLLALRISLPEVSGVRQAEAIDALFNLGWGRGEDLADPEAIRAALDAAGLDPGWVEQADAPEVKAKLRSETEAARDRGVFGVPTFAVGSELFWGYDQLDYVVQALRGEPLVSEEELMAIAPRGAAASRI